MVPLTGSKFLHTKALQTSKSGYMKGDLVTHDGVTWVSLVNNNLTEPGYGDGKWDLYS